jgi:hypothetical protein
MFSISASLVKTHPANMPQRAIAAPLCQSFAACNLSRSGRHRHGTPFAKLILLGSL